MRIVRGRRRHSANDTAPQQIEGENFVGADSGEDKMMEAAEMRLRLEVAMGGQRRIDEDVEVEGSARSRSAGAAPSGNSVKNLLRICREGAMRASDEEIRVQRERCAIDEMQLRHGKR